MARANDQSRPGRQPKPLATHAAIRYPELVRVRRGLLVVGVLALIAGVVSIAVPIIASVSIALFIGWVIGLLVGINLILWGAWAIVAAQAMKPRRRLH